MLQQRQFMLGSQGPRENSADEQKGACINWRKSTCFSSVPEAGRNNERNISGRELWVLGHVLLGKSSKQELQLVVKVCCHGHQGGCQHFPLLVVGRRYRSTDGPPQIPYRNFKVISTTASKLTSSPILPLCPTKYFDPNLGIPLSESSLSFVNPSVKWSKSALPGRYPLLTSCPLYLLIEHISNVDAAAIECYSRHASLRSGTADEPGVRVSSMIIVREDRPPT